MGKRQTRLFPADLLPKAAWLAGREANLVFTDHTTLHGVILEVTARQVSMRDMRLKKRTLPLETVAEITLDQVADW